MNIFNFLKKNKGFDFLCIGDIMTDAFIKLKNAELSEDNHHEHKKICIPFGEKVPYESVTEICGVGNSANASITISRLGLNSSILSHTGNDFYGQKNKEVLEKNKVNTDLFTIEDNKKSNYHYVLWYNHERTILINHHLYDYSIPKSLMEKKIKTKYIYLSSLGENTLEFHKDLSQYLDKNPDIKLVFQPGTFQIKFGIEKLKDIYQKTDLFFCNVEEAIIILNANENNKDIKSLLKGIKDLGVKLPVITDGPEGAYTYDESGQVLHMPIYPDIAAPIERTGAGDAFASTFSAAKALGCENKNALMWASINSMSVCQYIGARDGLLTKSKIEEYLKNKQADWDIKYL